MMELGRDSGGLGPDSGGHVSTRVCGDRSAGVCVYLPYLDACLRNAVSIGQSPEGELPVYCIKHENFEFLMFISQRPLATV